MTTLDTVFQKWWELKDYIDSRHFSI
jgi:hypothetical protein